MAYHLLTIRAYCPPSARLGFARRPAGRLVAAGLLCAAFVNAGISAAPAARAACNTAGTSPASILCAVNIARAKNGQGPVRLNARLTKSALRFARYLARSRQFSHYAGRSSPTSRGRAAGYRGLVDEDLGVGQRSAAQVVAAWMAHPPHRRVILGRWTRGVGVASASGYWVFDAGH